MKSFIVLMLVLTFNTTAYAEDLTLFAGNLSDQSVNNIIKIDSRNTNILSESTPSERSPGGGYGSYYDWGEAQNGYGYCYKWTENGSVLNEGRPVSNYLCEEVNPSYVEWGEAQNGWGYCYQKTPYGVAMNEGKPVSNYRCEAVSPSYYEWGEAQNGHTYCYQWAENNVVLNEGKPVSDYYCEY